MTKWSDLLVDFILNDSDTQTRNYLANALVSAEGFSVKRAELEAKEFAHTCQIKDTDTLRRILESGIPTLRLYAARELAHLADVEAIGSFLRSLEKTRTDKKSKAYQTYRATLSQLIYNIAAIPQPEHLPYYLDLLRWQKRYQLPIKPLASAITTLATTWPSPELQEALPFLKGHPRARQAIETSLLPGARYPIPAERPTPPENLPLPAATDTMHLGVEILPTPAAAPVQKRPRSLWARLSGKT